MGNAAEADLDSLKFIIQADNHPCLLGITDSSELSVRAGPLGLQS